MERFKRSEGRGTTEGERNGRWEREPERKERKRSMGWKKRERKSGEEILKELRPMDDIFMRHMLRDNLPLVQHVLSTITGIDGLEIISCETQRDMSQLIGARSIILDVYARDSEGRIYNLEIQRRSSGADPHRARYHSSVLDVENLRAGQDFKDLPETYTIFIMEEDIFGRGVAVYHIERVNREMDNQPFGDGEHILYVNGAYKGKDPLGQLIHDFNCKDASEMYVGLMAEEMRRLKESQEGVIEMGSVLDEMKEEYVGYGMRRGMRKGMRKGLRQGRKEGREEGRQEGRQEGQQEGIRQNSLETAKRMLAANKYTLDEIARISGLSKREVKELSR